MTNPMLQTNDTTTSPVTVTVLLVAIEMSLKTWRLVMGAQNQARRRVKTVEGGDYAALHGDGGERTLSVAGGYPGDPLL